MPNDYAIIKAPDGTQIRFPASMSDTDIERAMSKLYPGPLQTGKGMEHPYDPTNDNAAMAMHGAVSLMGHPAASINAERRSDENFSSPAPIPKTIGQAMGGTPPQTPAGMEDVSHIAQSMPAVSGAMMGFEGVPATAESIETGVSRLLRDPVTGRVTVSPTAIAERLIPQRPEVVAREAAAARDARLTEEGEKLMRRGRQQDALDRQSARTERIQAKAAAKPIPPFTGTTLPDTNYPNLSSQPAPAPIQDFSSRQLAARPIAPPTPFSGAKVPDVNYPNISAVPAPTPQQEFSIRQAAARPIPPATPFQGVSAPNVNYPNIHTAEAPTPAQEFSARQAMSVPAPLEPKPGFGAGATFSNDPNLPPANITATPATPMAQPNVKFVRSYEPGQTTGIRGAADLGKGRMVLTPQEAQTADLQYQQNRVLAHQRGMSYAGGRVPATGRTVPQRPMPIETQEYPGPREVVPLKDEDEDEP
jgi:hypothetical protein